MSLRECLRYISLHYIIALRKANAISSLWSQIFLWSSFTLPGWFVGSLFCKELFAFQNLLRFKRWSGHYKALLHLWFYVNSSFQKNKNFDVESENFFLIYSECLHCQMATHNGVRTDLRTMLNEHSAFISLHLFWILLLNHYPHIFKHRLGKLLVRSVPF